MKLPEKLEVLVITLSDRAARGEYSDLSGPRIGELLSGYAGPMDWQYRITYKLIPDDPAVLREILSDAAEKYNVIFTTGGTGIGPRDITVDTVKPLLTKEIPGIMEYIRTRHGAVKPSALLSRSVAGIMKNALIYTLPGSVRAVEEYMEEILKTLQHTIYMQYGIDTHSRH